ncbi:DUF6281 family protein [Streptomyces cavernicola]|uniref:DUF6281 family protein n=1 Tax=Streptomyces cavernicola TaxID=3043613 RepID=UPI0038D1D4AC
MRVPGGVANRRELSDTAMSWGCAVFTDKWSVCMANEQVKLRCSSLGLLAGVVLAVALVTGCSSNSTSGTAGSCAYILNYKARDYGEVVNVDFSVGHRIGTAHPYPCKAPEGQAEGPSTDSQGGSSGRKDGVSPNLSEKVAVYRVRGLTPKVAIAISGNDGEPRLFAVQPHGKLPPEVRKLAKKESGS